MEAMMATDLVDPAVEYVDEDRDFLHHSVAPNTQILQDQMGKF
jgi:hypothetical protein